MLTEQPKVTRADDRRAKESPPPRIERKVSGGGETLVLTGDWRHAAISGVYGEMLELQRGLSGKPLEIDLSGVSNFDTAGAWLVRKTMAAARLAGAEAQIAGASKPVATLIAGIPDMVDRTAAEPVERPPLFERLFAPIGKAMYELGDDLVASLYILGSAVRGAQLKLDRSSGISPAAIVTQIDHMGVRAVPIIGDSQVISAALGPSGPIDMRCAKFSRISPAISLVTSAALIGASGSSGIAGECTQLGPRSNRQGHVTGRLMRSRRSMTSPLPVEPRALSLMRWRSCSRSLSNRCP